MSIAPIVILSYWRSWRSLDIVLLTIVKVISMVSLRRLILLILDNFILNNPFIENSTTFLSKKLIYIFKYLSKYNYN